jgi:hypothetical protein
MSSSASREHRAISVLPTVWMLPSDSSLEAETGEFSIPRPSSGKNANDIATDLSMIEERLAKSKRFPQ